MTGDLIIGLILFAIIGGAGFKIYRDKKNGVVCSGCPHSKSCTTAQSCPSTTQKKTVC